MKNKAVLFIVTAVTLLLSSNLSVAQAPILGKAANYVLFTIAGAMGNTGASDILGNIGTNNGAITGFGAPSIMVGSIDSGNAATVQCSIDLVAAYTQLYNTAPTSTTHTPAFGTGETLFAGVYSIAAAGSVAGDLTLDAQGDPNAVFIFKFGGAFTTGAATTIILLNGTKPCNVFWGAEGAISMAAVTTMKGTLIANNGAISMGAGGNLDGRMFSTTGAVSVYGVSIPISSCFLLPVELLSFTVVCDNQNALVKWSTASETNDNYFTVERSIDGVNWQVAGKVAASAGTALMHTYSFLDYLPGKGISYYRLMQTDFSGNYKYGNIVYIEKCATEASENLMLYPNPSNGKFSLLYTGERDKVYSIEIFNSSGQKVYHSIGVQTKIDLSGKKPGVYFVHVNLNSKTLEQKIVLSE
jgi:ice-binding like protein/type IX secretion system substrate protein